jgi:hypothetical protein
MTTDFLTLLIGLALVAVVVTALSAIFSNRGRAQSEARSRQMQQEASRFFARIQQSGKLPSPQTNIILQAGETALLDESSVLFESRAYRVGGGAGTRIGGVYIGGGVSESRQRLKQIDQGRVTLTSKRLIFDGSMENRALRLSDIVSVQLWSDAIEVSTQRRAKSLVLQVANPLIWKGVVEQLAAAKIVASRAPDTPGEPS